MAYKTKGKSGVTALEEPSTMFKVHCEKAFMSIEHGLAQVRKATEDNTVAIEGLSKIVTNGLSHKVDAIEKRMWAIASTAIVTLLGVVVQLVIMWLKA